jgi:hypothetical protein
MLRLEKATGRHASRPVALRPGNIRAAVTERAPGEYELRLDDRAAPDFFLILTLRVGDDRDAVLRMIAEGNPNCHDD